MVWTGQSVRLGQGSKLPSRKHKPSSMQLALLTNQLLTPQRDLNSINNYVKSSYYSLTATTTEDQASNPSDSPIIASFMLDSNASISVTNALTDLLQPIKLLNLIPITSADGTSIHATHVGTSCLGTLIHYVPKSAVKLVSFRSLTASGYMVHTRKDRSIVITEPNGAILCSFPVQPNNTWIFSRQLMTGNLSPATAVPNGLVYEICEIYIDDVLIHGKSK